ncbi:MAG: hypothetical protein Q8862_01290 [Bacteroidota bacterium]|nr:hypothetical protein [Bacteroidota bacterium]
MHDFLNEILPIGVILTFIGTMVTIYYTRRNLKTTKYIDTVTSERIKWLDTIRNDITNLIMNIHFTLKVYSENFREIENETRDFENNIEAQMEAQQRYFDTPTSSALGRQKMLWSEGDFIKYLYVFKLRLNPNEDKNIIEIIDYFIKFYTESEYKSASEIPIAREKVITLVELTQSLLKDEWEKVKKESLGKIKRNKKQHTHNKV